MKLRKHFMTFVAGILAFSLNGGVSSVSASITDSNFTCPDVYGSGGVPKVDCGDGYRLVYQHSNPDLRKYDVPTAVEQFARRKDNATSVYIKIQSLENVTCASSASRISVRVYGITQSEKDGMKSWIDVGKFNNRTCKTSVNIPADGCSYLITNWVNERGDSHALLGMKTDNSCVAVSGLWSPDSTGNYTTF